MSWFNLTEDERREVRDNPSVQAYVEELRVQITMAKDEVVSAMLDEQESAANHARRMAGRVDGIEMAIKILERDR
jgi:hypothetical protein